VTRRRWRSRAAYEGFLRGHEGEYRRRSQSAERLYVRETPLGQFDACSSGEDPTTHRGPTMPHDTPDPVLSGLDALVGEWTIGLASPVDPPAGGGWVSFEWLSGGRFLIQRWGLEAPEFPDGLAVIGADPSSGALAQHYFDSRGVQRVYGMSLADGVWKLWRDGEDFSQRFTGTFSDDGRRITGTWEKTGEGGAWEHDFDMSYVKTR
jgi:hypothetical protein